MQEKYISLVQQQDIVQEAKQLAGGEEEMEEVRDSWLKLGRLLASSEDSRKIKEDIRAQRSALPTTTVWQI